MVSTLRAYAHDLLVLPSTCLATSKEAEPYAFGFSVAVNAPGLRLICRLGPCEKDPQHRPDRRNARRARSPATEMRN
jgi:aromatic ring hydroxylase